jgi:FHS family glucose/mannose:H+ symporter-like MFS transporter
MLTSLAMVGAASVIMAVGKDFTSAKLFFLLSGMSFALAKISMYSALGIICPTPRDHAGFMSLMEGFFMVGALAGFWLFGGFMRMGVQTDGGWFYVYWVILILAAGVWLLVWTMRLDESDAEGAASTGGPGEEFRRMADLVRKPMVLVFLPVIALYLSVEQSVNSWLPSFNNKVLLLSDDVSVTLVSLYAGSIALGRMLGGWIMRRVDWFIVLQVCLVMACLVLLAVLPLAGGVKEGTWQLPTFWDNGSLMGMTWPEWASLPAAAFLLPLIGLFLAPVYPALSSTILSSLPRSRQSGMTGLLIVFTALGGTTGSLFTGYLFGAFGGRTAFYVMLVPLTLLIALMPVFRRLHSKRSISG